MALCGGEDCYLQDGQQHRYEHPGGYLSLLVPLPRGSSQRGVASRSAHDLTMTGSPERELRTSNERL